MKVEGKTAFAMVLIVICVFILASKLMLPTSINIVVEGKTTFVREIPNIYTLSDCILISVSSFLLGASAFYLLFLEPEPSREMMALIEVDNDKSKNDDFTRFLKGNEEKIIKVLLETGEMNQTELGVRTGIPKSTLSRTLQDMERRGIIIRYDEGMSKMVKLK